MRLFAVTILCGSSLLLAACSDRETSSNEGGASTTTTTSSSTNTGGNGGTGGSGGQSTGGSGGAGGALPGGIYELDGVDQTLPSTDDLAPFGELAGDTPLVGLGESVHTSGGFLALKARLIRYLIAEKGFRVLAMETPRTDAKLTAAYVATCQGTPEDALQGIFGVFAADSTRDLAEWMCQFNQAHPSDPVVFVGFDAQQPWSDLTELKAFFTAAAPADADALDASLSTCDGYGFETATDYYTSGEFDMPYSDADLATCTAGMDALDTYLTDNAAALAAATSQAELEWARVASLSLRSWQGEKFYFNSDVKKSYEARDVAMAAILERSRELAFPDAKAIVWAHNYHLTEAHDTVPELGLEKTITTGTVLKKDLGDAYHAYALLGYDVEINWPGIGNGPIGGTPAAKSIETMLHGLGRETLFVDFGSPSLATFLPPGTKLSVGFPSAAPLVPAEQFHGAFYLEHSPPMDALYW